MCQLRQVPARRHSCAVPQRRQQTRGQAQLRRWRGPPARHREGAGRSTELQPHAEASPRVFPNLNLMVPVWLCQVRIFSLGFGLGEALQTLAEISPGRWAQLGRKAGCPVPALIFITARKMAPENQAGAGMIRPGRQRHLPVPSIAPSCSQPQTLCEHLRPRAGRYAPLCRRNAATFRVCSTTAW